MKIYMLLLKMLFCKYILKYSTGRVVKNFATKAGIVYIKFAQILSTQNYGNIFTEEDRKDISSICDECNPIKFKDIKNIIENEYGEDINSKFLQIDENPVGSASISQVHRAVLKNGNVVAIKVKRKDVTDSIEKEISRIKKLMHRFGKVVKFGNYVGGDRALDLFLSWIYEETDFRHEVENIKKYTKFANEVNDKVDGCTKIKLPKVYEDLCTDNIIVMEYIDTKTINKMELNKENEEKIKKAINSYIKSSFYALLNDKQVVFHGDPHGGNIYVDDDGNIGFLDMGLVMCMSIEDSALTQKFFVALYTKNSEKLYNLFAPYSNMNETQDKLFKEDIVKLCNKVDNMTVTEYFCECINICTKYEFLPPNFLFCMAKAFLCLNGISTFIKNLITGNELLNEQVAEYFVNRGIKDCEDMVLSGIRIVPNIIRNYTKYGIVKGVSSEIVHIKEFRNKLQESLEHCDDFLRLINF